MEMNLSVHPMKNIVRGGANGQIPNFVNKNYVNL